MAASRAKVQNGVPRSQQGQQKHKRHGVFSGAPKSAERGSFRAKAETLVMRVFRRDSHGLGERNLSSTELASDTGAVSDQPLMPSMGITVHPFQNVPDTSNRVCIVSMASRTEH